MTRRAVLFLCLLVILRTGTASAQDDSSYSTMLRIYEDNDFMNIWANGTDKYYSNGTRLDLFYRKRHPSRFFIDRWMPRAGEGSVTTFGWGAMQTIITPYDLTKRIPNNKDYPYSGALFALHSKHSSNPVKKYNLQTELMIGVMGPPSLARQVQETMHRIINYTPPRGWDHQLPTDLLLNINFTAEKMLAQDACHVEFIGGLKGFAGTALNGGALYTMLRIGRPQPYFNGWISQYTGQRTGRTWQWYFFVKPGVEYLATNAFLEGGIFTRLNDTDEETFPGELAAAHRNRFAGKLDYGVVLAHRKMSISFTQTGSTRVKKTVKAHGIGNLSLHIAW